MSSKSIVTVSELSKIYSQFEDSLTTAKEEYDESLKQWSEILNDVNENFLSNYLVSYGDSFNTQYQRMQIKSKANSFLGTEKIKFVAIDGSCHKSDQEGFMSFYGGAYGSMGDIKFAGDEQAKLEYERWDFDKDVSMVAFLPLPPDQIEVSTGDQKAEGKMYTDAEIKELSSIHTKIMQLAEVYLAWSQIQGSDPVELLLLDTSLSGLLGNTSYRPDSVNLDEGNFDGQELDFFDLKAGLAHPFNLEMDIPGSYDFQPFERILAVAQENNSLEVDKNDTGLSHTSFKKACTVLEKANMGEKAGENTIVLSKSPDNAWRNCRNVFQTICEKLFKQKDSEALTFTDSDGNKRYMTPDDITFLTGIGLRDIIERCWSRNILLVGVAKDSSSKYFYRNFIGSLDASDRLSESYQNLPLSDRKIIEMLAYIKGDASAPWGTIEFDSAFMSLHPEKDENGEKQVKGWEILGLGETTRPPRIFLRSVFQYLLDHDASISSHAIFVDRLAYPGWDDEDSLQWELSTEELGTLTPLLFNKQNKPRLQELTQFLLSVVVKNHFPEALGYPDPLRKADMGAKAMKRKVKRLMDSGEVAMQANPLEKSLREIREEFNR